MCLFFLNPSTVQVLFASRRIPPRAPPSFTQVLSDCDIFALFYLLSLCLARHTLSLSPLCRLHREIPPPFPPVFKMYCRDFSSGCPAQFPSLELVLSLPKLSIRLPPPLRTSFFLLGRGFFSTVWLPQLASVSGSPCCPFFFFSSVPSSKFAAFFPRFIELVAIPSSRPAGPYIIPFF